MQDALHALNRRLTCVAVADIALDHFETGAKLGARETLHLVEVALMPGREIVEADDVLPDLQQRLDEIGSDEPGSTRDEPARGIAGEPVGKIWRKNDGAFLTSDAQSGR